MEGVEGTGEHPHVAQAEVWRRAHHRKLRFWSCSIFHNVFHFSSGDYVLFGYCISSAVTCL